MKITNLNIIVYLLVLSTFLSCHKKEEKIDVLVVGGGTSGVSAGIAAARMNVKTIIVEESEWLGGMLTSAGVSAVDGNYRLPSGFWGEFKDSLINYYGSAKALKTGWVSNVQFEPSVGNKILQSIATKEKTLKIYFRSRLKSIKKVNEKWIVAVETPKGKLILHPKIVIDATELGDVALKCGVKYDVGMESRQITQEDVAPEEANQIIQDLTYVAVLKDFGRDVTIPRPTGYDSTVFACSCVNSLCKKPKNTDRRWSADKMITYGKLPNNKYLINWPIEGNDYYLNLIGKTERKRSLALKEAKNHTLCFIYFIQKELGMNTLGLADDEFPTKDKLPIIPYHRESLRIHGLVRFTLNHIMTPYKQSEKLYRTCVAVGDYPVDHHHEKYPQSTILPNLYFHPVPSYGLPLGVMIPQNIKGLIVAEKSISVSNIVNGTTRLQPVVLQIGQAAGVLAALTVKNKKEVETVSVRDVQKVLLLQGSYLLPYLDVVKESTLFLPLQRIGVTGILKGVGKNEGWENQTWFRANDILIWSDIEGIEDVYSDVEIPKENKSLTLNDLLIFIKEIDPKQNNLINRAKEIYQIFDFNEFDINRQITRAEAAVLIDQILNPFEKEVDIKGNYKK